MCNVNDWQGNKLSKLVSSLCILNGCHKCPWMRFCYVEFKSVRNVTYSLTKALIWRNWCTVSALYSFISLGYYCLARIIFSTLLYLYKTAWRYYYV
jgi:hypothetical protein